MEDRAGTLAELLSLGEEDLAHATQGWKAGAAALLARELARNRGALSKADEPADLRRRSFSMQAALPEWLQERRFTCAQCVVTAYRLPSSTATA